MNALKGYTLDQFNARAQELYESEHHSHFVQFVLTGIQNNEQAVLDPIQGAIQNPNNIASTRDYDSLIGLSDDIEVQRSIYVYPIANPRDTLTEKIHLKYPITVGRDVSSVICCFNLS